MDENIATYELAYKSLLREITDFIPFIKDCNSVKGKLQILKELEKVIKPFSENKVYSVAIVSDKQFNNNLISKLKIKPEDAELYRFYCRKRLK